MPKIDRDRASGASALTPRTSSSQATKLPGPVAGSQAFPQSAAFSAFGPRPKPSSVALPHSHSARPLRHGISMLPGPVVPERPRDVAVQNWRERAGPWFEPREHEEFMQLIHGPEYQFRSDQYEDDSDASDYEDIPAPDLTGLDRQAREERFQRETAALFERKDGILSGHRAASFTQRDFLKKFDPQSSGACLALSVQWLQSAHADPQQPASQRLESITSDEQAQRVLDMQSLSDKLHDELTYRTYRPLKELSESGHLQGVQFGRYLTCKAEQGMTLSDVGGQVALRLQHEKASKYTLLIPTPGAHAIACEKLDDGRFRLFEPNHGAYEVEADQLDELMAGVLASHINLVKSIEEQGGRGEVPIGSLIAKTEVRIIPVDISKP